MATKVGEGFGFVCWSQTLSTQNQLQKSIQLVGQTWGGRLLKGCYSLKISNFSLIAFVLAIFEFSQIDNASF
jgi:hypothetical protein